MLQHHERSGELLALNRILSQWEFTDDLRQIFCTRFFGSSKNHKHIFIQKFCIIKVFHNPLIYGLTFLYRLPLIAIVLTCSPLSYQNYLYVYITLNKQWKNNDSDISWYLPCLHLVFGKYLGSIFYPEGFLCRLHFTGHGKSHYRQSSCYHILPITLLLFLLKLVIYVKETTHHTLQAVESNFSGLPFTFSEQLLQWRQLFLTYWKVRLEITVTSGSFHWKHLAVVKELPAAFILGDNNIDTLTANIWDLVLPATSQSLQCNKGC